MIDISGMILRRIWRWGLGVSAYSIGIPVRDGQATVDHVVRAAAAQRPAPAEILVCDDGSRDESALVAGNAGARLIFHPRSFGLAAARNSLLEACRTDFIVYFDADAVPQGGCAEALLDPFQDQRVGAAGGRGCEVGEATFADRWRARTTPQSHGDRDLDDDWMVMGLCSAFRAAALRQVGGFSRRFTHCGEDVEVSTRLRRAGWRLAYRPQAVVDHVRSDGPLGLLRQAYLHHREATRALRCLDEPLAPLTGAAFQALLPALRRDMKALDAFSTALTLANLTVRLAGVWAGKKNRGSERDRKK